jgi:DNA-binding NarL/FixJ family response regulator
VTAPTRPGPTARQLEILALMAEGMSNFEIGLHLGVSEETVKTLARRLYRSLGVYNRAGAVSAGYRRGLIPG